MTERMKQRIEKWKAKIKRVTLGLIVKERKGKQEKRKTRVTEVRELKAEV